MDMEMPCVCGCGELFDLNEGYTSLNSNIVICRECYEIEEKEARIEELIESIERLEEDIIDMSSSIAELEYQIQAATSELGDLQDDLKQLQNEV